MSGSPLPQDWKKTLILIEQKKDNEFRPIGTGFLIEYKSANVLTTCRHVIVDRQGNRRQDLFFAYNTKKGEIVRRSHEELVQQAINWVFHPSEEIDVAISLFAYDPKNEEPLRIGRDLFESAQDIEEGEEILYLGFPLGYRQEDKIRPLVRTGIIALVKPDETYLADASVSLGNSGGPVFLKPSIIDWKTRTLGRISPAKLIGMIAGYLPMEDVAISAHTGRPRVVFEENSGLASVIGCRYINETLESDAFDSQLKKLIPQVEGKVDSPAASSNSG